MKKLFTLLVILLLTATAWGQSPEKMSYQAVIRNSSNQLIAGQMVGMQITILQGSATGTTVYMETQTSETNENGLLSMEIGTGNVVHGSFLYIDWSDGPYFIRTEADPSGGTNYTITGTSQILSVPYALHSKSSEILTGNITENQIIDLQDYLITETDPVFAGWDRSTGIAITESQITDLKEYLTEEADPLFEASPAASINDDLIGEWNEAYSWGDHDGLYHPLSWMPAWTEIVDKPEFASVAISGDYNDLINTPDEFFEAGPGITITGGIISADLSLEVSEEGDILTLTPGNTVYVPGISYANYSIPVVTTKPVTNITATRAYGSGNVMFYGAAAVTETGICWSVNQPPTVADNFVASGVYFGDFISVLDELTPNTIYFARAYAKTGSDTYYGETVLFTTSDIIPVPTLTTTEVSGITETTALSGGNISADGGSEVTARGVCWSTNPSPTTAGSKTTNGSGTGLFTSYMTGLTLNTRYYVRAYATNENGTNYGSELIFKTAGVIPTVTTSTPAGMAAGTAILGGNVTDQGSAAVTDRGVCLSTSSNPTIADYKVPSGTGTGSFSTADARLKPNTAYYVRAYATNSVGTSYGQNQQFTTLDAFYESFEDGFPGGSTGAWSIVTDDPAEGYYCLYAHQNGAVVSFTRTLSNPGEITYWSRTYAVTGTSSITFYIDDNEQVTTSNGSWLQRSFPVSAGTHTFKWKYNSSYGSNKGWIDYIIMPK